MPRRVLWRGLPAGVPFVQGQAFLWGAHHPHCYRHHNHLLWFRGHPLCIGCTMMAMGAVVMLPLLLLVPWAQVGFVAWAGVTVLGVLPTALQPWCQAKKFKVVSRGMLGAVCVWYLAGLLLVDLPGNPWLARVLGVAVMVAVDRGLRMLRTRKTPDPCRGCPHGTYPTCEWNLPRIFPELVGQPLSIEPASTRQACEDRDRMPGVTS